MANLAEEAASKSEKAKEEDNISEIRYLCLKFVQVTFKVLLLNALH